MTFYTPTYMRPSYLAVCRKSVQEQTCRDFQHMVIVDDAGIGVDGMFADIERHAANMRGEYVFILADDDRLMGPGCLENLKAAVEGLKKPPVVIVKNHKWGKIFPLDWEAEPRLTRIDTGNFVIRADVFQENVGNFGRRYEGDFDFIRCLWDQGYEFAWIDLLFSAMQVGGKGRTEKEIMQEMGPMKVKILRSFSTLRGNYRKGQVVEMPPTADWVRAGFAEPMEGAVSGQLSAVSQKGVSTETLKPAERAVGRGGKRTKQ